MSTRAGCPRRFIRTETVRKADSFNDASYTADARMPLRRDRESLKNRIASIPNIDAVLREDLREDLRVAPNVGYC